MKLQSSTIADSRDADPDGLAWSQEGPDVGGRSCSGWHRLTRSRGSTRLGVGAVSVSSEERLASRRIPIGCDLRHDVADAIGLGKGFTQRGLRRTFNDLCRAAAIESLLTRSISGHLTERMQHHYSTVNADEQPVSIARVIDLMAARDERLGLGGAPGGAPDPEGGAPNEKAG